MHLATLFTLVLGSFVAAAPSTQHAQITVEISNTDDAPQNQLDALHPSSQELPVTTTASNQGGGPYETTLPFKFILRATHAKITNPPSATLPFGFRDLKAGGWPKGELGFTTVFELRNGKLLTSGNRGLGYHPHAIYPPWTSVHRLDPEVFSGFDLVAFSIFAGGRIRHFLQFEKQGDLFFGAFTIKPEQPIFIGNPHDPHLVDGRIHLAIEPIGPYGKPSDNDINEDFGEEVL